MRRGVSALYGPSMALRCLVPVLLAIACTSAASCGSAGPADVTSPAPAHDASATTTATPAVTSSTSTTRPVPESACAELRRLEPLPIAATPPLVEISGAVLSRHSPEAIWVHEDSGNEPVLTELGLDGLERSRWVVPGVQNVDWEDLAAAEDAEGRRHLFIGDVGDNRRVRPHLEVLRVPEPGAGSVAGTTSPPATLRLVLPDGPADVEAVLVDPGTADLVLITKDLGGAAQVLVAAGAAWAPDGATLLLESRGTLRLGPGQAVLAGDLSPDGMLVALRTPFRVLVWRHDPGASVTDTLLATEPCRAPAVFDPFGEALAFLDDGYVLVGEGEAAELVSVR
jgi:hypothetical protein